MILVDTSAWVDFLRDTGSRTQQLLTLAISSGEDLAATEPVRMELLAGARDAAARLQIARIMDSVHWLPIVVESDFDAAATTYRLCRSAGFTPRGLVDCLIAAVAMRTSSAVLASDGDFDHMAKVMPFSVVR